MISNFAFFTALQNAADLKVSVGAAFCNAVKMQKSSRTIILIFKQFFAVKVFVIFLSERKTSFCLKKFGRIKMTIKNRNYKNPFYPNSFLLFYWHLVM